MSASHTITQGKATFPLVGVSFCADEVSRLIPNQPLQVIPEPHNPYDPNALRVVTLQGLPVGYVPKAIAETLTRDFPGATFRATVATLRHHDTVTVGADIRIENNITPVRRTAEGRQ